MRWTAEAIGVLRGWTAAGGSFSDVAVEFPKGLAALLGLLGITAGFQLVRKGVQRAQMRFVLLALPCVGLGVSFLLDLAGYSPFPLFSHG